MAILAQSTTYTRSFVMYLTGEGTTKSPATGKTVTVNLSKAGGTFAAAGGTVTEIANGWYKVALTTTDTNTLGDLAFNCTAAGSDPTDFSDQIGPVISNVIQINGGLTSGNNAILSLAALNIQNSSGDAILAKSTGGNGNGINSIGNGTGSGIAGVAGATGSGLGLQGGATSGAGLAANAIGGNSVGLSCQGFGSGSGINTVGGTTGHGLAANGGNTSGHGIVGQATTSGVGLDLIGVGNAGLLSSGGTNFNGASFVGAGTGNGLGITGGATGNGIATVGGATSGNGFDSRANGSGVGFNVVGVGNVSILATQGISGPLDASEKTSIADTLLKRDMSAVTGEASRSLLNCLRFLRNKWSTSSNTLTVTKEDDTTSAWTATITTNAGAPPIVSFSGN